MKQRKILQQTVDTKHKVATFSHTGIQLQDSTSLASDTSREDGTFKGIFIVRGKSAISHKSASLRFNNCKPAKQI